MPSFCPHGANSSVHITHQIMVNQAGTTKLTTPSFYSNYASTHKLLHVLDYFYFLYLLEPRGLRAISSYLCFLSNPLHNIPLSSDHNRFVLSLNIQRVGDFEALSRKMESHEGAKRVRGSSICQVN
ncbi:hypothetical protein CEXT_279141 [Caerostris extrusa]|uniref:Uncharacterized protein n=1 Tax=Caerostris extrusa TaxID=172846 RepID=A0AAV4XI17_CAEEX|nr:hypothetical protein CEXT_279141 [Caerostris extrusa]